MKRARIAARARVDLDGHAVYLESKRRGYARRFLFAFQRTLRRVERPPESVAFFGFEAPDLRNVRVCAVDGFENLLILFRAAAGGTEILRVLHASRNIEGMADEILPE